MSSSRVRPQGVDIQRPVSQATSLTQDLTEVSLPKSNRIELIAPNLIFKESGKEMESAGEGESTEARIERLGRERPKEFKSIWQECGFVFSIAMSQVLTVNITLRLESVR